jgi:hypothetical protein
MTAYTPRAYVRVPPHPLDAYFDAMEPPRENIGTTQIDRALVRFEIVV